jgi:hypothetical protein
MHVAGASNLLLQRADRMYRGKHCQQQEFPDSYLQWPLGSGKVLDQVGTAGAVRAADRFSATGCSNTAGRQSFLIVWPGTRSLSRNASGWPIIKRSPRSKSTYGCSSFLATKSPRQLKRSTPRRNGTPSFGRRVDRHRQGWCSSISKITARKPFDLPAFFSTRSSCLNASNSTRGRKSTVTSTHVSQNELMGNLA